HQEVDKLFKAFEKLKDGDKDDEREDVVMQVCQALTIHAQIEEEIFYPAARRAIKDKDLLDEAKVEHEGIKRLVSELEDMSPGDELYDSKMTVLGEYVKHHVKEEEGELFPEVKKAKLDLDELGERMQARKQELEAKLSS